MIYVGTDLKFALNIECEGFSMDEDDFEVVLVNGCKRLLISKDEMSRSEDGTWFLCFNSEDVGQGTITLIVYAHVPDADFSDGERTEIYKTELCKIESL